MNLDSSDAAEYLTDTSMLAWEDLSFLDLTPEYMQSRLEREHDPQTG